DVNRYVSNYWECKSSKYLRDKTLGKFHLIPSIIVNFKSIPINKRGYNNILVIVDRFIK
ncbi:hypothetical protein GE21DRAFT_1181077, partial [Neurospora crassa]